MGDLIDIARLEKAEELIEHLDRERAELIAENNALREKLAKQKGDPKKSEKKK